MLRDLLESAARLLEPGDCFFCGAAAGPGRAWCRACGLRIPRIEGPLCPACSLPLPTGPSHLCQKCLERKPPFDKTLALLAYQDLAASLVQGIKYNGNLFLLKKLLDQPTRARCLEYARAADLIVPVPLHPSRLLRRGYNQSLLIAGEVFRGSGVEIEPGALKRVRRTASQTGMNAPRRRRNLKGAFTADREKVRGKRIILVDDVMTTTATTAECGRTLVRAGAAGVRVFVLARTPAG